MQTIRPYQWKLFHVPAIFHPALAHFTEKDDRDLGHTDSLLHSRLIETLIHPYPTVQVFSNKIEGPQALTVFPEVIAIAHVGEHSNFYLRMPEDYTGKFQQPAYFENPQRLIKFAEENQNMDGTGLLVPAVDFLRANARRKPFAVVKGEAAQIVPDNMHGLSVPSLLFELPQTAEMPKNFGQAWHIATPDSIPDFMNLVYEEDLRLAEQAGEPVDPHA